MRQGIGRGPKADAPDSTAFGEALSDLRASGCGFLVTGGVAEDIHGGACRHFLGEESPHSHVQLVITTSGNQLDGEDAAGLGDTRRVIEIDTEYRSATTSSESAANPTGPRHTVVDLGAAGRAAMDEIEAASPPSGYGAGDLRLCFDAIDAGIERYGEQRMFKFLHVMLGMIRSRKGIAHVHLRTDRNSEAARVLEPLFDGLVELRLATDRPQQRWHLRNAELSSEWLSVEV